LDPKVEVDSPIAFRSDEDEESEEDTRELLIVEPSRSTLESNSELEEKAELRNGSVDG
jgi:hypothetical protein